jgi:hypothetical protein
MIVVLLRLVLLLSLLMLLLLVNLLHATVMDGDSPLMSMNVNVTIITPSSHPLEIGQSIHQKLATVELAG